MTLAVLALANADAIESLLELALAYAALANVELCSTETISWFVRVRQISKVSVRFTFAKAILLY
jgi:hypothetical protein